MSVDSELEERNKNSEIVQSLFQKYQADLHSRLKDAQEKVQREILSRCTFLSSITIELHRTIVELDSKVIFLKAQFANADNATYLAMSVQFQNYVKNEVLPNLDLLININFDGITNSLFKLEKRDQIDLK